MLQAELDEIIQPDSDQLLANLTSSTGPRFRELNQRVRIWTLHAVWKHTLCMHHLYVCSCATAYLLNALCGPDKYHPIDASLLLASEASTDQPV
jgi:hypothetical protein